MTPDQIFKAESKLRELKKCEAALDSWTEFVFGATIESVRGAAPDFPIGSSDLSVMLKDAARRELEQKATNLRLNLAQMGVDVGVRLSEGPEGPR